MKFRTKMTICMVFLLSVAFGIGGSLLISSSFQAALNKEKTSAQRTCQMLLNTLSVVGSYNNVEDTLRQLDGSRMEWTGLQVTSNGESIYRSGQLPEAQDDGGNTLQLLGQQLLISCSVGSGLTDVRLRAAFDISSIYNQRDVQLGIYRGTFLLVVAVGTGLSFLLCTWLTRPLRQLTRVSRELAAGNLAGRVRVSSGDELGRLSREFNQMADKLEESVGSLKAAMERQEEFMGSFAHELKTPMTSIIGYADLLRSQELQEPERREAANYVFSEGKRLESLSLKLLDLLVLEKDDVPLQSCSPKSLIENTAREFNPILKKQNISLHCRCEMGNCLLDPDLFKSLLYNLMDNARKAMDQGGRILIQSEMTGDGCLLRVVDDGRGMPQEALQKVTEAFYRVDKSRSRAQGGAGLGLALCSRIVELHRGDIRFSSKEGIGTCVTVTLRGGKA
ncbi:MAG: HAMP domain-containing sensor histidine kinase [Oscillospiraceae bacterium]|nr:HAMP domain-containing sensor histidine kinase [Oscillospiraceae bacterium]